MDTLLAMAPPANGQATAPWYIQMFPLFLVLIAFYFALIMPQRKRQKALDTMVKSLKAGDKITTSSGIIGVVVSIKEKTVSIRSADTKLEILKSAVAEVTERAAEGVPSQS
jgi:preprotein translocase subunit YajC